LHATVLFGCWQVGEDPLQMSLVQTLPSFEQPVLLEASASAGQLLALPLQLSGRSHSPALARQEVELDATVSAGHEPEAPVQVSCASQIPLALRQTVVVAAKVSAGHDVLLPLQVSCVSQTPPAARQVTPALLASCVHDADVPLQTS